MAWTKKSSPPHSLPSVSKTDAIEALSSTSQGRMQEEPSLSASGFTRRPKASP